jgi:hypothetical protein
LTLIAILTLGFFLGLRHATDPDHIVAVSAIASRARSIRAAMWIGASWGFGHTAAILAVGGSIVLFGLVIPPRLGLSMEFSVAIMLVVLGVWNLRGAMRSIGQAAHAAQHGQPAAPVVAQAPSSVRPFAIGLVHGLAGSAAVALLVLASVTEPAWALFYLALFGTGTVLGMMLLTTALAIPAAATAQRFRNFERGLVRVTGFASVIFGLALVYQIGFVDGLFSAQPTWDPH